MFRRPSARDEVRDVSRPGSASRQRNGRRAGGGRSTPPLDQAEDLAAPAKSCRTDPPLRNVYGVRGGDDRDLFHLARRHRIVDGYLGPSSREIPPTREHSAETGTSATSRPT